MYQFQKYPNLRYESLFRLLCEILRGLDLFKPEQSKYDPEIFDALSVLSTEDWSLLERMAELEGIAPLIYWAVRNSQELRAACRPETYNFLQLAYYASSARNAVLIHELEHIVRVLDEAGIPVIVLKGAALAQTIYKDIALRPMNDLDILVQYEQLDQAIDLILALGYQSYEYSIHGALEQQVGHAVPLTHVAKPGIEVEVHWRLVGGEASLFQPQMDWFWQKEQRWQSHSNYFSVLSNAAHLLFLCAHLGLQHGIGKGYLIWFVDIYQLSKRMDEKIDWNTFTQQAKIFGWSAASYYVFKGTGDYLGAEFPTGILSILRSQISRQEETLVLKKSITEQNIAFGILTNLMGLQPSVRIKSMKTYLLPSPKFMRQRYQVRSNWILPFFYLYRWWNVGRRLIESIRFRWVTKFHP